MFDLHCHSIHSDGTLTPADLVARAAQRGVTVLALTDHDDTGGLSAARTAAGEHNLQLIDGVEISVTWRGCTLHVVGLGIDPRNAALQAGLAATRGGRVARARRMAAALDELGIAGSLEGARRLAANPQMIGRMHFARFLKQRGVVKDIKTAFKRFLGSSQPCYVPQVWASLDDAVRWINGSGGVAVIAHPHRYPLDNALMRELLDEFSDLGGAAIEVISSIHEHRCREFAEHARRYGLSVSTGSDFHSPEESHHDIGSLPALPSGVTPVWRQLTESGMPRQAS